MPAITGLQAIAIASALAQAGAKWTPFYRKPVDANGVPMGDPTRIGCLLGKTYTKGQTNLIRVDVPGVVASKDVTRFEGVLSGSAMPQIGDLLCTGGLRIKIMSVNADSAPLVVLTLDT